MIWLIITIYFFDKKKKNFYFFDKKLIVVQNSEMNEQFINSFHCYPNKEIHFMCE